MQNTSLTDTPLVRVESICVSEVSFFYTSYSDRRALIFVSVLEKNFKGLFGYLGDRVKLDGLILLCYCSFYIQLIVSAYR